MVKSAVILFLIDNEQRETPFHEEKRLSLLQALTRDVVATNTKEMKLKDLDELDFGDGKEVNSLTSMEFWANRLFTAVA